MDAILNENPLFILARDFHKDDLRSGKFPYLLNDNQETYILGFCRGISYATKKQEKEIDDLIKKLEELKAIKLSL